VLSGSLNFKKPSIQVIKYFRIKELLVSILRKRIRIKELPVPIISKTLKN
jgi:hypothetical protein